MYTIRQLGCVSVSVFRYKQSACLFSVHFHQTLPCFIPYFILVFFYFLFQNCCLPLVFLTFALFLFIYLSHTLSFGFCELLFVFEPTNFSIQFYLLLSSSDSLDERSLFHLNKIVRSSEFEKLTAIIRNMKTSKYSTGCTEYTFTQA